MHETLAGQDLHVYAKLLNGGPLNHYKVFLKEDPQMKAWHYRDNQRISSITLVSDVGYVFQDFRNNIKSYQEEGYPGCECYRLSVCGVCLNV